MYEHQRNISPKKPPFIQQANCLDIHILTSAILYTVSSIAWNTAIANARYASIPPYQAQLSDSHSPGWTKTIHQPEIGHLGVLKRIHIKACTHLGLDVPQGLVFSP